jgi:hypothetical protein
MPGTPQKTGIPRGIPVSSRWFMLRLSYNAEKLNIERPAAQTPEETGSAPVKENTPTSMGITVSCEPVILFMS